MTRKSNNKDKIHKYLYRYQNIFNLSTSNYNHTKEKIIRKHSQNIIKYWVDKYLGKSESLNPNSEKAKRLKLKL